MSYAVHYKGIIISENLITIEDVINDMIDFASEEGLKRKVTLSQDDPGVDIYYNDAAEIPIHLVVEKTKSGAMVVNRFTEISPDNEMEMAAFKEVIGKLNERYFNGNLNISYPFD